MTSMRVTMRRRDVLLGVVGLTAGSLLVVGLWSAHRAWHGPIPGTAPATSGAPALLQVEHEADHPDARDDARAAAALAGLDLAHVTTDAAGALAPTGAGTARLTLEPDLQRSAAGILTAHHLPEAALLLMDVATGRLLAYASHVEGGPLRDLCVEATAPSASVFKIVTAAALVEDAHLGPDTRQCYSGGESRINAIDLVEDPQRDRWCTTLAGALGRSINTVFARLASTHLEPPQLEAMARRLGYGAPVPFDAPVQPSAVKMPSETLEFARTAAGFWNTTLSPLQAVDLSATVARGGDAVRPSIVETVVSPAGQVLWAAPEEPAVHHVLARETAEALSAMMAHTVGEGTSWRAFHDPRGKTFLPDIEVAGKTGTLTDGATQRYYTWFTGFAPMHPQEGERQVAVTALAVNGPTWQVKANVVAREMLRAYFAAQGARGVSKPSVTSIARHKREPATK
jgi:cell division protein FtsI/penicillin-binding protein 2